MDNAQIERLVQEIVRGISQSASSQGGTAVAEDNIASWDSLHQMRTFIAIEEKFGIRFAPSEIAPPRNMEYLVKMVRQKLGAAS